MICYVVCGATIIYINRQLGHLVFSYLLPALSSVIIYSITKSLQNHHYTPTNHRDVVACFRRRQSVMTIGVYDPCCLTCFVRSWHCYL